MSRWRIFTYESIYHTLKYITDSYMSIHTTFYIEIYFVYFLLTLYSRNWHGIWNVFSHGSEHLKWYLEPRSVAK